jgi:hypothetical protein
VIYGTWVTVADSLAGTGHYGKRRGDHGASSYPILRLTCGTRSAIDTGFDRIAAAEQGLARRLRPAMLLSAEGRYAGGDLVDTLAPAGGLLLASLSLPVRPRRLWLLIRRRGR